ncbi:VOC family protein [Chitinimonas sp.]|uniref:VOC family protein n=1 Tax=Chitinimonas sp. TaxID=1934313 RepID=UPI0035B0E7F7
MSILALHHIQIAIPAAGEADARVFYGQLLGLPEIPKPMPLAARGGVWFQCGAVQIHLGIEDDFRAAKKAHPAFVVGDLVALGQALSAAGFAFTEPQEALSGYRRAFTADPFGNRVELLQALPG